MTARATATQAQICRAIAAAKASGLYVAGIRPDGTVLTLDTPPLALATPPALDVVDKWADVEA